MLGGSGSLPFLDQTSVGSGLGEVTWPCNEGGEGKQTLCCVHTFFIQHIFQRAAIHGHLATDQECVSVSTD